MTHLPDDLAPRRLAAQELATRTPPIKLTEQARLEARARVAAWQALLPEVREVCLADQATPAEIARLARLTPHAQLAAVGLVRLP